MYLDFTRSLIFIAFLLIATSVSAQRANLSGKITAANNGQPLAGAMVSLADGEEVIRYGEVTDENGRYVFEQIKPGRYELTINYVGYLTYVESGYLVGSGPETNRNFELQLNSDPTMEAVEVTATRDATVVNPLKRQVKLEEVRRLPATFYDPARLLALSPGVAQTNDQANHLSVRGNSPNRNLWRLQGLAIVNPNHTANAGTINDQPTLSGGGVNALSAQLLDNSTFYAGGLPVEYGNATAGTFDMRLRPGNNKKRQYQLQAGFIGFDAAMEGPLDREVSNSGSYLVNYRYSFTGLLADLGVDFGGEEIRFQDVSAHIHKPIGKPGQRGEISLFGVLGWNSNEFTGKDENLEEAKEQFDIDYRGKLAIGGFNYYQYFGNIKVTVAAATSGNNQRREQVRRSNPGFRDERFGIRQSRFNGRAEFEYLSGGYATFKVGTEYLSDGLLGVDNFPGIGSSTYNVLSPYANLNYRIKRLGLSAGLRYSNYKDLENSNVLEPRFNLTYFSKNSSISIITERNSRIPVQASLWLPVVPENGFVPVTNQVTISWQMGLDQSQGFLASAYYQITPGDYASFTNTSLAFREVFANGLLRVAPFQFEFMQRLSDSRSYGIELNYHKSLEANAWYYNANFSLFRSEVQSQSGEWIDNRFSREFIFQAFLGKEWEGRNKSNLKRTFGFGLSAIIMGGENFQPVSPGSSDIEPNRVFYIHSLGFTDRMPTYFRPDLRLYRRKYHKKTTTTLSLDIQNLSGIENTAYRYFDQVTQQIEDRKQLGLIPVLSYRVEWR